MKNTTKSNHWSNYWQGGQLTSLPQDFKGNYDGAILDFWNNCFSKLKPKSKILDLCTGNCAIALLASEYSLKNKLDFHITAIDSANISKKQIKTKSSIQTKALENIYLIANCKIENIDMEENSFELVISQYGVEYTDLRKTSKIIHKILKPKSKLIMVCHSRDSQVVEYMKKEEQDYLTIINSGFYKYLSSFLKGKISYRTLIKIMKRIQTQLNKDFLDSPSELLKSVLIIIDSFVTTNKKELTSNYSEITSIINDHKFAYLRTKDLLRVCLIINKNKHWYSDICDSGMKLLKSENLLYSENIIAGKAYFFKK